MFADRSTILLKVQVGIGALFRNIQERATRLSAIRAMRVVGIYSSFALTREDIVWHRR